MPDHAYPLISANSLQGFAEQVFIAAGCGREEARSVAYHLVDANLTGHDSHGIGKLPEYVQAISEGRARIGELGEIVIDSGAIIVLDGRRGMGQVLAARMMDLGIARSHELGAAVTGLRNAHHIGRIGAWAEQCAARGCISIHFVNVTGHTPYVAPFGGRDGRLATNPMTIGVPATGHPPIILDFATSKVAWGKLFVANAKGEPAPEGAVIDSAGQPTLDPAVVMKPPTGAILPFGEHKGSGIAFLCEVLAGALTGGGTNNATAPRDNTAINNMLSIIIDPAAVGDTSQFRADVDAAIDWVKASPPRQGVDEVLIAGEPERRTRAIRRRDGIPLDFTTLAALNAVASSLGQPELSPAR